MVRYIKKNKEIIILISVLLVLSICIELPSWLKGGYFVGGGDIKTQWYPFYVLNRRETVNAIKNHTFPFYSWILFLGNNIWASKTSYGLFDFFNLIFYFCRENYFWVYDVQVILKIITAGITSYLLIKTIFNNKKAGLLGGILYASSSYVLYFSSQSGFMSFAALAPLYLLGIVLFIKNNNKVPFIISTTLLLLTNYYLFFSLTLLSPFIFLYSYYNIKGKFKFVIKKLLIIVGLYFIGMLLTGIFVFPSFLYLLQNERVGNYNNNLVIYPNIKLYLNILYSLFTPSHLSIYGNNIFDFNEHTYKELCLFSSSFITIFSLQIFVIKNKRFKYSSLLLEGVFFIILFIPLLGSILNGFSEVCFRWTYLFIILNIVISIYCYFVEEAYNKKPLFLTVGCIIVLMFLTFFIGLFASKLKFSDYYLQFFILVCVVLLMICYSISIIKNRKFIYIFLGIELIITSLFYGNRKLTTLISNEDLASVNSVLSDEYSESINEHLLSLNTNNDKIFFRTYVDYEDLYWSFSRNMNLLYGIEGTMSYDSTYEPSFSDMYGIKEKGVIKDIYWEYSIDDPELLNFISCKYALTLTEDKIPFNNYRIVEPDFRGGIIISENLDYEPIGKTYSSRVDNANDFFTLNEKIVSEDKEIDKYLASNKNNEMKQVYYYNNHFESIIDSDDTSFVVLKFSYDKGFKVKVNGIQQKTYKCNGGMIGFPIEKGENIIEIDFVPNGFKGGAVMTLIGTIAFVFIIVIDLKNQRNKKIA